MPLTAPRADNREEVRLLVLSVGCSEAARKTGIPLNTILSWSARGKWLQPPEPQLPPTVQASNKGAIAAIKPADALAETLRERHGQTRLHQSKFLVRASEKLADVPENELLDHAEKGKTLADMASKVYPEQSGRDARISIFGSQIAVMMAGNGQETDPD